LILIKEVKMIYPYTLTVRRWEDGSYTLQLRSIVGGQAQVSALTPVTSGAEVEAAAEDLLEAAGIIPPP
jgi:hypothetical protein